MEAQCIANRVTSGERVADGIADRMLDDMDRLGAIRLREDIAAQSEQREACQQHGDQRHASDHRSHVFTGCSTFR
jgi:hypothetical protein